MGLNFVKYHGAGNDFILIDGRTIDYSIPMDENMISHLCHRQFGIGADGLMILYPSDLADFKMVYYNSDGRPSSLCGNGSRCAVAFAFAEGLIKARKINFETFDGIHQAEIMEDGIVRFEIHNVAKWKEEEDFIFMDTGSPHMVFFKEKIDDLELQKMGEQWRNASPLKEEGSNVNIIEDKGAFALIRTFERGVEGETLACGTGVTAAAIALHIKKGLDEGSYEYALKAKGGDLTVSFNYAKGLFSELILTGPTKRVFEGTYIL